MNNGARSLGRERKLAVDPLMPFFVIVVVVVFVLFFVVVFSLTLADSPIFNGERTSTDTLEAIPVSPS